ncbi:MAG: hypothetical protein KME29_34325 [Calothrix sp. FI2-JRJ7]|jgi:hypothetical protein|nr:hypothetical protein [Calothrix sp. FI2-JRJ7]
MLIFFIHGVKTQKSTYADVRGVAIGVVEESKFLNRADGAAFCQQL